MSNTIAVKLNWRRNSNGGAPITNYLLQYSANYGVTWQNVDTASILKTATISNLPAGLPYLFRVAATNLVGPSQYSTPTFAVRAPKTNFSTNANDVAAFTAETDFVPQAVPGWPTGTYSRIPNMTSNTSPSGVASGGSNVGQNYLAGGSAEWRAFAGVPEPNYYPSYAWLANVNRDNDNNFSAYLQYEFPTPSLIGGYRLQSGWNFYDYTRPKVWSFSGSNDGVNFDTLDTQTLTGNEDFYTNNTKFGGIFTANLATPVAYKIYRWTFTRNFTSNSAVTGVAAAQVLPPSNAISYQWQVWWSNNWRNLLKQNDATLNLTPDMYTAVIGEAPPGTVRVRCVISCANYATIVTPETRWLSLSVDSSNFSANFYSDNYWPSGSVTENGVSYSVMNMDTAEPVYFNLDNWSYSGDDLSWFTGNNWTLKLQQSADGASWTDYYLSNQRTTTPSAYTQILPPSGPSYWRWFVQYNWPLTLTDGSQCADKSPPTAVFGYAKIIVPAPE